MPGFACSIGWSVLSVGGIGLLPRGHGTLASVLTAVVFVLLLPYLPDDRWMRLAYWSGGIIVLFLLGVILIRTCVKQPYDNPDIVLDEVIGTAIALAPLLLRAELRWWPVVLTVAVFGILDYYKLFGIAAVDRLGMPSAVLLDDMLAGVYAAVLAALLSSGV